MEAAPALANSVTHVPGLKCYLCLRIEPSEVSSLKSEVSSLKRSVADSCRTFSLPASDFTLQTSHFRLHTSDFTLQTSHFRLLSSDEHRHRLVVAAQQECAAWRAVPTRRATDLTRAG